MQYLERSNNRRQSRRSSLPPHIQSDIDRLTRYLGQRQREHVAIFDIGTRAARLLVGPKNSTGNWVKSEFFNVGYVYELGADVDREKRTLDVGSRSLRRTANFMQTYRQALNRGGVSEIDAIGTAIFRWLTNRVEVLDYIERRSGLRIDAISGGLEAELTLRSVYTILERHPDETLKPAPSDYIAVADQGGGSTEVSWMRWSERLEDRPRIDSVRSDRLGTVALRNEFFNRNAKGETVEPGKNRSNIGPQTKRISQLARQEFQDWPSLLRASRKAGEKVHLFGVGSAITTAANVAGFKNHRRPLSSEAMDAEVDRLAEKYDSSGRQVLSLYKALEGLQGSGAKAFENPRRIKSDLSVLYGLPIFSEVAKAMDVQEISVFGFGLRFGYYLWKYAQHEPLPFVRSDTAGPFAFVSYARKDRLPVYRELHELNSAGFRVAYDESIKPTEIYQEVISRLISGCAIVVVFWTKNSVRSKEVQKEILFAIRQRKRILQVFLEDVEVPHEIDFELGAEQYVSRHDLAFDEYLELIASAIPETCRKP